MCVVTGAVLSELSRAFTFCKGYVIYKEMVLFIANTVQSYVFVPYNLTCYEIQLPLNFQ